MQYKREISERCLQLSHTFSVLVLTGARQTGKTTMLRAIFPNHSYVSLDLPAEAELAENEPEAFLSRYPTPVVIDEVQYAPKIFRHLKVVIDKDPQKKGQFILTGSQKFNLMKEVSESLAGRVAIVELETFSLSEIKKVLSFSNPSKFLYERILTRGMFPQLWADEKLSHLEYYRSYLATYLERDVRQIINVTSLRDFGRFIRMCATCNGNIVNKTDLARDVGISPNTATQWLSVLEASNQIILLEPYHSNIGKRMIKSPKLYFADTGLLCFLLGIDEKSIMTAPEIGSIWETFVFSELRKYREQKAPEIFIYFYRDNQGTEVDFLIQKNAKINLFEAKFSENPGERDFRNIAKVEEYLGAKCGDKKVVCRTSVPRKALGKNGIELCHVWDMF